MRKEIRFLSQTLFPKLMIPFSYKEVFWLIPKLVLPSRLCTSSGF